MYFWKGAGLPTGDVCGVSILSVNAHDSYEI